MSRGFAGTLYSDLAQLEEWFAGAPAGAQVIYASGPVLDPKHPVKKLVDEWFATGEAVALPQRPVEEGYRYSLQRARPDQRNAGKKQRVTVEDDWRETSDGRIFLTLVRHANFGLPCPSNRELAIVGALYDRAGEPDPDAARYRLKLLQQQGRIQVEVSGPGRCFRRVRICETGRWTADEPKSVPLPGLEVRGAA